MELIVPRSWAELSTARGVSLLIRCSILLTPLLAIGCTMLAGETNGAVVSLVVVLAAVAAVVPDSHVGVLVLLVVAMQWLGGVDDAATPWSVPAAAALAAFHMSMAAAGVAPPNSVWTRPMWWRWLRRSVAVAMSAAPIWLLVAFGPTTGSNPILLSAALVAVALGATWSLTGAIRRQATRAATSTTEAAAAPPSVP